MSIGLTILKRLFFIKYLYQLGIRQSRQKTPKDSISILMFHDSVELFFQLSTEYLSASSRTNIGFMEYWGVINQKLQGQQLSQKNQMNRLNKARVNLKHHGILLNESDIESFRVNTSDFFSDNCSIVFGINFSEISLIDLIDNSDVKDIFKDAVNYYEQNNIKRALEYFSLTFKVLIYDFEQRFQVYRNRLFGIEKFIPRSEDGAVRSDLDNVSYAIANIQYKLKYLIYGINVNDFIKFSLLTPDIYFIRTDFRNYKIGKPLPFLEKKVELYSQDQLEFFKDFIIDCAVKLQEFDFDTLDLK